MSQSKKIWGLLFLLFLILFWEVLSQNDIIPKLFLPPPSQIALSFKKLFLSYDHWANIWSTFSRMIRGYSLGIFIAVTLGVIMGSSKTANQIFDPLVQLLRPIPSSAVIPVAILFFGIDDSMKIFVVAFACTWPILINTIEGMKNVDPIQIDTGKVFGMNEFEIIKDIKLPNAAPFIVSGMKISLAVSLALTITSEMVSGVDGLGLFILKTQGSFRIPEMYAGIITVALLGFSLHLIFVQAERKLLRWNRKMTRQF